MTEKSTFDQPNLIFRIKDSPLSTRIIKYVPQKGTDEEVIQWYRSEEVEVLYNYITSMEYYKNASFEELRLADYELNADMSKFTFRMSDFTRFHGWKHNCMFCGTGGNMHCVFNKDRDDMSVLPKPPLNIKSDRIFGVVTKTTSSDLWPTGSSSNAGCSQCGHIPTASVPTVSNQSSTASVPSVSNQNSTASVPSVSHQNSNASVPTVSNQSSTASVPSVSNQNSTASVPSVSHQNSTASVPTVSNQSSTASVPSVSNQNSTASVPSVSNKNSTTSVPTVSNQSSTASVPTVSNQSSTASVPSESNQNSTSSAPSPSNQNSTASVSRPFKQEKTSVSTPKLSDTAEILSVTTKLNFAVTSTEEPTCGVNSWYTILKTGLKQSDKETLIQNNPTLQHSLLKAPVLNEEIKRKINDELKNLDKDCQKKQDQIGNGLSAIVKATSLFIDEQRLVHGIQALYSAFKIFADLHYCITRERMKQIAAALDDDLSLTLMESERDDTLFGKNLKDRVDVDDIKIKMKTQEINVRTENSVSDQILGPNDSNEEEITNANNAVVSSSQDFEPNNKVTTKELPISTNKVPISTNKVPVLTKRVPVSTKEVPVPTNKVSASTIEGPVSTNEVNVSTNKVPVSTKEIPVSINEVSASTIEGAFSTKEVPVLTNKVPVSTKELPVSTNEAAVSIQESAISNLESHIAILQTEIINLRETLLNLTTGDSGCQVHQHSAINEWESAKQKEWSSQFLYKQLSRFKDDVQYAIKQYGIDNLLEKLENDTQTISVNDNYAC